jgi:ferredoxin, 2Fe-2S
VGRAFEVQFLPQRIAVRVDAAGVRRQPIGEAGSLLDLALAAGLPIEHSCGGLAACATCHCIVRSGGQSLSPAGAEELAQLPNAVGRVAESRLSCQAVPDGRCDVVVEIPVLE